MEIAKCNNCLKEVSEVGKTYYEAWEKKKDDFGLGRKEEVFCESCWKEKEKNYRNYPMDDDQEKRKITKNEITKKTSTGFVSKGDYICYDPTKKEWVKEENLTSANTENKPAGKGDKWIIGVILAVILIALLTFLLVIYGKKRKTTKKIKK